MSPPPLSLRSLYVPKRHQTRLQNPHKWTIRMRPPGRNMENRGRHCHHFKALWEILFDVLCGRIGQTKIKFWNTWSPRSECCAVWPFVVENENWRKGLNFIMITLFYYNEFYEFYYCYF